MTSVILRGIVLAAIGATWCGLGLAEEPPSINPFGPRAAQREDAIPGCADLSDGTVHPGQLYLTRDARLELFDENSKRRRDIPLAAVERIECRIKREWMEKEWRFREGANDQKVYTGRAYPAREYTHVLTLRNGETLLGSLNAIVYVRDYLTDKVVRLILHQRDKGSLDANPESLVFVRTIQLGEKAREAGVERATAKAKDANERAESEKRDFPQKRKGRQG